MCISVRADAATPKLYIRPDPGLRLRQQGGEWLSEQDLVDRNISAVRVRAIKKKCMLDHMWKFDRYEACRAVSSKTV